MLYYLHERSIDVSRYPQFGTRFDTPGDAAIELKANRAGRTHTITMVPSREECDAWREREQRRFDNGQYIELPFDSEMYARMDKRTGHAYADLHYAHVSLKESGKIAYTPSEEHGIKDRQLTVRPTKYLQDHCADLLTPDEIQQFAAMMKADRYVLKFARTADEIEAVYTASNGPSSCMSHGASNYECSCHPVRVYGDSDLAVAYYGEDDNVSARAICWPDREVYGRVYGDATVLERLLRDAGYGKGSMEGARVRLFEDDGRIIMPYVDGIDSGKIDGQWIVLGRRGDVCCSNTEGYGTDPENTYECRNCGTDISEGDNEDYNGHCYSCDEASWSCEDCGETSYSDDDRHEIDGGSHCQYCAEHNHSRDCEVCSGRFCEATYRRRDRNRREDTDYENRVCLACEREGYELCGDCNNWTVDSPCDCHDNETTVDSTLTAVAMSGNRCPDTLNLPLREDEN